MNRPFLPLLQMSESETLISMVNRMVENSSPRAQLFVQVRPLPGSMVPVIHLSCLRMVGSPLWDEAALPSVLICRASSPRERLSLLLPHCTVSPPFFMFVGDPKAHLLRHHHATLMVIDRPCGV